MSTTVTQSGSGAATVAITVSRGPAGAAGPNTVSTSTATDITGLIKGDGTAISAAIPGTDYVATNDSRLSDARTPTAHTHVLANITDAKITQGDTFGFQAGSISTSASGFFSGGSINTSGGATAAGGSITTNSGGSIDTSLGGGSITTNGTGSIQLGIDGTRTTLTGTATENRAISLPNASGTLETTAGAAAQIAAASSTTGGASKLWKSDASGNWQSGPAYTGTTAFDANGNIIMPDLHGIRWLKQDGSVSDFAVWAWQNHDVFGGELLLDSPFRIALIARGPLQLFPNDAGRFARKVIMSSGYASAANAAVEYMPSAALAFQSSVWNGAASVRSDITLQAHHLDTSGTNSILRVWDNAAVTGEDGGGNIYTAGRGDVTGNMIAEIYRDGIWTPGLAPSPVTLSDGATVTITCNKYKSRQVNKVTLGGNRALAFSGLVAGMRGVLYVEQDATGSRTLTLPSGAAYVGTYTLESDPYEVTRIEWEFDGVYTTYKTELVTYPPDADAAAFITRASITDDTQERAVNNLVLALKASNVSSLGTLWSRMHAVYPFVGGNATAHSKNLLADSRHITWSGSPTHNANGVTGDGSAAYGIADFKWSDISGSENSAGAYVYCRTSAPTVEGAMTAATDASSRRIGIRVASSASYALDGIFANNIQAGIQAAGSSDFRRAFTIIRSSSSSQRMFVNTTASSIITLATTSACNINMGILCRNSNSGVSQYSNANLALVAYFQGLTSEEQAAFHAIVTNFQTALGRANP